MLNLDIGRYLNCCALNSCGFVGEIPVVRVKLLKEGGDFLCYNVLRIAIMATCGPYGRAWFP